jgi:hypothetical protein
MANEVTAPRTRLEAREIVAAVGWPPVTGDDGRRVAGRRDWIELLRNGTRTQVVRALRKVLAMHTHEGRHTISAWAHVGAARVEPARVSARHSERDVTDTFWDFDRDEESAAIAKYTTAGELIASVPAIPLPAQVRIVEQCVRNARHAGLRLPTKILVRWREGRHGIAAGAVGHGAAGTVVYLSVNATPSDLRHTTYHELQHVADFTSGARLTRAEMEARSTEFAGSMMGWA